MKNNIEKFLLKKNFFIICPRAYSLGGFFQSLIEGLKIASYKEKKLIICIILFNNHGKHTKKRIYSTPIIFQIFLRLKIYQKIISIILSIYVNLNLIFERIKILSLLKLIFGKKFVEIFFFTSIGYNGFTNYFLTSKEEWKEALEKKFKFYFNKNEISKKINKFNFISIYAKDANYERISEISKYGISDIKKYSESIDFFINKGFEVVRVGDEFSKKFSFNSPKYYDFTSSNIFNLKNQYSLYEKSNFYFGAFSPGSLIANFFNKRFIVVNYWAFGNNAQTFSMNNFLIYKKVFSVKEKKILSLSEIFSKKEYFVEELTHFYNNREFIFIENSENEILNACKEFYNYNFISHDIGYYNKKSKLLEQYYQIRKLALDKVYKTTTNASLIPTVTRYYYAQINIPDFFLEKYLYPNKFLEEESLYYKNKFKL
jgi:putative glycosyltransferase (TIGR04372 family)